jgi:hypothetical protein
MTEPQLPPAGWYSDPNAPAQQRWWDGERWTEHAQRESQGPQSPPKPSQGPQSPPKESPPGEQPTLTDILLLRVTTPARFFENLLSFRLGCASIVIAALVGAGLTAIGGEGLSWLALPVLILVWWFGAANPGTVLYCPYCRKRVKAGANTCHHCQQRVA